MSGLVTAQQLWRSCPVFQPWYWASMLTLDTLHSGCVLLASFVLGKVHVDVSTHAPFCQISNQGTCKLQVEKVLFGFSPMTFKLFCQRSDSMQHRQYWISIDATYSLTLFNLFQCGFIMFEFNHKLAELLSVGCYAFIHYNLKLFPSFLGKPVSVCVMLTCYHSLLQSSPITHFLVLTHRSGRRPIWAAVITSRRVHLSWFRQPIS